MNWFPAVPGWDGIHPAMVMFPVALLLVAPLLVLASFFARGAWRAWAAAALVTMALGTLAAWLAVGSGHAAGQLVDKTKELEGAILRHESLGMTVRNLFTLLTVLWAVLVLLPTWLRRPIPQGLRIGVHVLFLAGYVASVGALARAADAGGRLVHQRGVHAMVDAPVASAASSPGNAK
jgi:uncharacterized membrane protein